MAGLNEQAPAEAGGEVAEFQYSIGQRPVLILSQLNIYHSARRLQTAACGGESIKQGEIRPARH
jgi:hypothetical protein